MEHHWFAKTREERESIWCSKTVDMPYAQKEERNFFGSVGFLVNKNIKDSMVEFRGDSSRVASLTIKINAKY